MPGRSSLGSADAPGNDACAAPEGAGASAVLFPMRAGTAAMAGVVLARFRRLPSDQLVEVAPLAAGGFLLVDHRQLCLIELVEELVPRNLFERVVPGVRCIG